MRVCKDSLSCRGGLELLFGNLKETEVDIPSNKGKVRPLCLAMQKTVDCIVSYRILVQGGAIALSFASC